MHFNVHNFERVRNVMMECGTIAVESGLSPVMFADNPGQAEELRTILERAGIAAVIGTDNRLGSVAGIPVLVPVDDLECAGEWISTHVAMSPRDEDDDDFVDDDDDDFDDDEDDDDDDFFFDDDDEEDDDDDDFEDDDDDD